jgi:hypothetical protein
MASNPQYAATPDVGIGVISTANANRDGTGTIGIVATAGASGTRIDGVQVKAAGTVTDGMVRLFLHDGTNARLYTEIPVAATTASATAPSFETAVTLDLAIPTGWSLRASTEKAETFNVIAFGGDF